ncbi:MAG: Rne/Rng family ribonuclease [Bacteroidaceae bacterium]|nr:Rne/Rng family ribonuclease [Prevotellaceae bacterium]MDY2849210.1 Rne/Rng family ribonuclease [Bacteroidaceae bacterium]
MSNEVIIDTQKKEISIALLEDGKLTEFQREELQQSYSVGNMYLAKVKKLMPGLNACFVDVGYERDAFLHFLDLGMNYFSYQKYLKQIRNTKRAIPISKAKVQPVLEKDKAIQEVLSVGDEVLVQIAKEPISTKGPRINCELNFAGRFLILMPFDNKISVSTKIRSSAERKRLTQLISSILPNNFGVIVRTVAEGKKAAELDQELKSLIKRWETTIQSVRKCTKYPKLVYEETSRAVGLLRDLFSPEFEAIHVNNSDTFNEIKDYLKVIAPEKENIVKLYNGQIPIFDKFAVTKQIKSSFGRTVTFKHGAYLIIEHTEALHVIDVNSGNRSKNSANQETGAIDVNIGAADEIARQLRLRDMGGIIIVDFIDMTQAEHREQLYKHMVEIMKKDRSRHNILPLSKFGLMQITRQRVRPVMDITVEETCPSCFGTGHIKSSLLFTDTLERKLKTLVMELGHAKLRLYVHPYVYAYINQGIISLKKKWKMKYGLGVKICPDQSLAILQYRFVDTHGDEIDMKEKHD